MTQTRNENPSSRISWLRILLAMAAAKNISTSTASNMPRKYTIAGVYPTRSDTARSTSLVDLDQAEIERLLFLDLENKDSNWLQKAREVYENGMHSGSYASLTLAKALDHSVILPEPDESYYKNSISYDPKHHDVYKLDVFGVNNGYGAPIHGTFRTSQNVLEKGNQPSPLKVFYSEGSNCMNGGTDGGNTDECFAAEGGIFLQGYGDMDYTYDPNRDTKFSSSLKSYSEDEGLRMYYCEHHGGCGNYKEYERFYHFYGVLDYGNHWIESAFLNKKTEFPKDFETKHGYEDVDFSGFADISRNAAISTATVAMNVFTQINRLMVEFGMDGCLKNTKDFSSYGSHLSMDSVVASWDQAAALYAGSALIAPSDGEASGIDTTKTGSMYYHMAETLAEEFGALEVVDEEPRSIVNRKVMEAFLAGKIGLTQSDCDGQVRDSYYHILHAMRAPWIQGVLKATFEFSNSDYDDLYDRELQRGKATAFVAALLPDLYHCQPAAAATVVEELGIIWPNTSAKNLRPDFNKVRNALEHQYQCLGVTCEEIGGLLNPETGVYYENTRPCGGYGNMISQRRESVAFKQDLATPSSESNNVSSSTNLVASGFFFVALALFVASVSVLVVTVRDRAHGRHADLGSTANRLMSGAISQVDYWLDRSQNTNSRFSNDAYSQVNTNSNNNYEVQLRSMTSETPLQPGTESLL